MTTSSSSRCVAGRDEEPSTAANRNHDDDKAQTQAPASPTSRLLNRIAALRDMETASAEPRRYFSYRTDIARNSDLANAAREELVGVGAQMDSTTHDLDIGRQQEVFETLEKDTELEKELNSEMASVVISRLEKAKSCAEKILSVLQALATAERAYAKSLKAIGSLTLTGEADGATLRAALADFVELPSRIGAAYEKATLSSQPPINLVRDLVGKLREACMNLRQGSLRVQGDVDKSIQTLKRAVESHREVCKAFDASVAASKASSRNTLASQKTRSIESDPWIAEGRIVERQAGLRMAQAQQRKYLADAFRRVGDFERQRITVTSTALTNAVEQMMCSISFDLQSGADAVLGALAAIDGEADLDAFTGMAADSIRGGEHISSRQADLIGYLWRQVERSSEIVRQGPVKRLVGCSWANGHAVLTRAGFLHWFKTETGEDWSFESGPIVSINLPRCEFELGDAPSWRLLESTAGSWWGSKVVGQTYSTSNVDSCMEWTASLKEIIQGFTSSKK
jgi:hypothetical protein